MTPRLAPEPHDPRLWIGEAQNHLTIARRYDATLNLRLLCCEAHFGAEKEVKSVLIALDKGFPYTHDVGALLDRAEDAGETIPAKVRNGERLTSYSGAGRYPSTADERSPTTREEYDEALADATTIVDWAAGRVAALLADKDKPVDRG